MANFEQSFSYLVMDEGGYVNDPRDSGGETYRGISRKNFPNWDGWARVDAAKAKTDPSFPASLDSDSILQSSVAQFYRKQYWRFDGIESQPIADKIFDEAVNLEGSGDAGPMIRLVQQALRVLGRAGVVLDGQYGPSTESHINAVDPAKLLTELKVQIGVYYCKLNRPEFLAGWMRRALK